MLLAVTKAIYAVILIQHQLGVVIEVGSSTDKTDY
jgi:hypothetical protein